MKLPVCRLPDTTHVFYPKSGTKLGHCDISHRITPCDWSNNHSPQPSLSQCQRNAIYNVKISDWIARISWWQRRQTEIIDVKFATHLHFRGVRLRHANCRYNATQCCKMHNLARCRNELRASPSNCTGLHERNQSLLLPLFVPMTITIRVHQFNTTTTGNHISVTDTRFASHCEQMTNADMTWQCMRALAYRPPIYNQVHSRPTWIHFLKIQCMKTYIKLSFLGKLHKILCIICTNRLTKLSNKL